MNEGAFELLDYGFEDHTVHVLDAEHPEHGYVGVVLHRAPFPKDKSLRDLVAAHLTEEKTRLTGYTVLDERTAEHAGAPAIDLSVRFRHEGEAIYQAQSHLALPDLWMYFAVSSPIAARAACDGWIAGILSSLRLRSDD